jgi:hypothetical protein
MRIGKGLQTFEHLNFNQSAVCNAPGKSIGIVFRKYAIFSPLPRFL